MARSYDADSVRVTFGGLSEMLDEFEGRVESALRPAAHQGALVLYNEVRQRVPRDTGQLQAAIYRWHDANASGPERQSYVVGVNKVKAPHWHNVEYGHWRYNKIINGHPQRSKSRGSARGPGAHDLPGALNAPVFVPAQPYFRPAYDAAIGRAMNAGYRRLVEKIQDPES